MNIYDLLNSTVSVKKRFDLCSDFSDKNRDELGAEEEKKVYDLIRNICSMAMSVENDKVEFRPAFIFDGKRTYALEDISEDEYDQLISLAHQRLPLSIRARVADVLWTQKKKYKLAILASEAYFDLFNVLFDDDDWFVALNMAKRAACISLQIKNKELHNKVCTEIYNHLIRIDGLDEHFLSISLIEFLLEHSFGDLNIIVSIIDKILVLNKINPNKMEHAFDLKFKCLNKLYGVDFARMVNLDKASYFVDYAEQVYKTDKVGAIRAETFFQKAIFIFRNNGEPKRAEDIHRRLVEVQKDILKSMVPYTQKIDASGTIEKISKLMDGLSFEECVVRLGQTTHFYTKKEGEEHVLDDLKKFPMSHMFGTSVLNNTGQTTCALKGLDIADPFKDLKLLDLHIHRKIFQLEDFSGNLYFRFVFDYIREKFDISSQKFDFMFDDNAIVPISRKRIIEKGIRLAFEGDYYAAVHILAPQTENIFRYIADCAGALTVTLENDGTSKQKTLTSIFDLPELVDCYDNDILFLFDGLLNEQSGANIRNEIAHGIMDESRGSTGACLYFICALIRLLIISSPKSLSMLLNEEKFKIPETVLDCDVEIADGDTN